MLVLTQTVCTIYTGDAWGLLAGACYPADSSGLTAMQWLRGRAQPALEGTLSSKKLKRSQAASSGLQPALSWGALLKELQVQRSRRLRHDCAGEAVPSSQPLASLMYCCS